MHGFNFSVNLTEVPPAAKELIAGAFVAATPSSPNSGPGKNSIIAKGDAASPPPCHNPNLLLLWPRGV
jgi:hypothetical protein